MKVKHLIWLWLFFPGAIAAQKTVVSDEQTWFGLFSQTRLSRHWGIWFDAHLRLKDHFVNDLSQTIVRAGPMYYLNDDVRITAAYAFVNTFPGTGHTGTSVPEHRPWQQIQWFIRGKNARLMQWIRVEERFRREVLNDDELGDGYLFNWRFRHNMALFVPLTKKRFDKGGWQAVINNELFVNAGSNIVYNHFDQNRFFVGMIYPFNKHAQLQGGYMNVYQQQSSGNQFRSLHSIRLFYFHNFDLRKN